jgi:hypothetical protein
MKARNPEDRSQVDPDSKFNIKVVAGLTALVAGTVTLVVFALQAY